MASKTIQVSIGRSDANGLAVACADLARAFRALFDPYRPELHYMRGPGPKWHAKHAGPASLLSA
jgi:hypothetical protein